LVQLARLRNVGVLAIYAHKPAEIIDLPPPHLPQLRYAESVRKQFVTTDTLSRQFYFNLPTHYLCFAPVLKQWKDYHNVEHAEMMQLEQFMRHIYPVLPRGSGSFRAALGGAEKLGIVRIQGQQVIPTFIGRTVAALLPDTANLATLHKQIAQRGTTQTLAEVSPVSGAILRCLLYTDTVAKFIIDVLSNIGRHNPTSMRSLALHGAEHDKIITPTIFFKPESIAEITDDRGRLNWHSIQSHHFRSTTFMQYKSILKHAGIIKAHRLGGSSAKKYDPDKDIWEMAI
jgi:hypothetical protein